MPISTLYSRMMKLGIKKAEHGTTGMMKQDWEYLAV
jgi:hypothetical protein